MALTQTTGKSHARRIATWTGDSINVTVAHWAD